MSDERTLREDLIIREGSSPEGKKGILYHSNLRQIIFLDF